MMLLYLQLPVTRVINKTDYVVVSPEITFGELLQVFKKENKRFAVFLKDAKPVGIITERDVVKALNQNYSLSESVINLAKKELVKIRKNSTLLHAFNLMVENFIRRLLVVDEKGNFEGVITQQDLIYYSPEDMFKGEGKIRDILELKHSLIYADEEETLEEALKKLVKYNIGVLPVLNRDLKLVGIISESDFVKLEFKDLKAKLREVAIKEVIKIRDNQPITEAVELFRRFSIRHLVVVDKDDRVINVISQRDLVQSLTCTYTEFLEHCLRQAQSFISLLPEIVLEISDCDSECKITWMNEYSKKYFGEEFLDNVVYQLFDYDDWNRIYGMLKKERVISKEVVKGQKGNYYEVTGSYVDFGTKEGKIKLFLRDITQEVHKEESYLREIRFLKSYLNNSLDFIVVIDPAGKIYFANTTIQRALGYKEEEILKKTIYDIVDLPKEIIDRNIELLLKKGIEVKGRRFYRDIHQNKIPVEIKSKAIILNGRSFILINARDVKELHEEEQVLKKSLADYKAFYNYVAELNFAQKEEDLFPVLERFLLNRVEAIHYYEIYPDLDEVKLTYLAGKKSYWQDCLYKEIKDCGVYKTGKSFVSLENQQCPLFKRPKLNHLCIPLIFEGKLNGLITLIKKNPFTNEEIKYYEDIINAFNVYLNQLRLLREYQDLSVKDPLLNIYNRRFLIEFLKKESERVRRIGHFFSIVLMDLDHFKKINDTYGHFVGDRVLKEFTHLVLSNVREMDVLGRWGGEEFVLLLPETPKEKAFFVAERIREEIEKNIIFIDPNFPIQITASFGLAEFPRDGDSIEKVLKIADQRLYKAKALGRNKVVME
ncbi:MAG: diguanylate cyclase [Caldimicrobium sp.]|nr:diguanylate cyclase [Caldimicrobium sp.]